MRHKKLMMRILVADDEPNHVTRVEQLLRAEGHEVWGAILNGKDDSPRLCIEKASECRWDVLLVGPLVEHFAGDAFVGSLRAILPRLRVVELPRPVSKDKLFELIRLQPVERSPA